MCQMHLQHAMQWGYLASLHILMTWVRGIAAFNKSYWNEPSLLQQVKPKINPFKEGRVAPIEKVLQHSPIISNRCIKFNLGEELFHGTCWENMNKASIEPGKKEQCGAVLSTMLVSKWMESIERKRSINFLWYSGVGSQPGKYLATLGKRYGTHPKHSRSRWHLVLFHPSEGLTGWQKMSRLPLA